MAYLTDSIEKSQNFLSDKYDQFMGALQETKRQVEIGEICCDDGNTSCNLQIKHEEELAKELEKQLNMPVEVKICKPDEEYNDPSSVVKALEKRVDHLELLFLSSTWYSHRLSGKRKQVKGPQKGS
jgi:hypothetical protein